MTKQFRPLLAEDFVEDKLMYPGYLSPKIDGIRAFERGAQLMSRSMKPIPNPYVQELFAKYQHLDGELAVGDPWSPTLMQDTYSGVMKKVRNVVDVKWHVFDHIEREDLPFRDRYAVADARIQLVNDPNVVLVQQHLITCREELDHWEAYYLGLGYEGVMYRRVDGIYKQGRSTVKEGILLKVKRFKDAEAIVIGFEEQMENTNEATKDELGHTKRSSAKDGLVGKGTLGAWRVRGVNGPFKDVEFSVGIGVGVTTAFRQEVWDNRDTHMGRTMTYSYFPIGVKDKPRFPKFRAYRDPMDM